MREDLQGGRSDLEDQERLTEATNTKRSNLSRLERKVFQVEDIGRGFFRHLVRQRVIYVRAPGSQ